MYTVPWIGAHRALAEDYSRSIVHYDLFTSEVQIVRQRGICGHFDWNHLLASASLG